MQRQRGVQGRDSEAGAVHRQPEVLVRERARLSIRHQEGSHQDTVRWSFGQSTQLLWKGKPFRTTMDDCFPIFPWSDIASILQNTCNVIFMK